MAKSELYWWPLGHADHRRRRLPRAAWRAGRRGDEDGCRLSSRRDTSWRCSRRARGSGRAREAVPAEVAHRRRADRARGGRAARAGGDRRHRPALAARPAACPLREADPAGRSEGRGSVAGGARGDRPADGGDRPAGRRSVMSRPLLVIDGDSLAHRAYHALPKSMRARRASRATRSSASRTSSCACGRPRSRAPSIVGWDTLFVPTYRHELFAGYQGGREFDDELLEQLDLLPELVRSFGLRGREGRRATRPTTFSRPQSRTRRNGAARRVVVTSDRDSFQLASERTTILQPTRGVSELARIGPGGGARALRRRAGAGAGLHRACAAIPRTSFPARAASARRRRRTSWRSTGRWRRCSRTAASRRRRRNSRLYRRMATLDASAPYLPS